MTFWLFTTGAGALPVLLACQQIIISSIIKRTKTKISFSHMLLICILGKIMGGLYLYKDGK